MSHFKYLPLPTFDDEFAQEVEVDEQENSPIDRDIRIEFVQNPPQVQANVPSNEGEAPATVVYITHPDPGLREFITHLVSTYMYIQPPPYHNAEMDELVRFGTEGDFMVDEESRDEIDRSCATLTRVHWPLWCFMLVVIPVGHMGNDRDWRSVSSWGNCSATVHI
ncbi:hypothetical protein PLEOSDRAFT_172090 [Pleurotus ostreatus PC15]|uniref:Uncharacterized protein n=1 Tax=Pleurotus ostreatus (strain PC15) TaxID=1137138 RepID=A0A067N4S9_PLEO1|nr:hypothetical protein PLEOSDRAFT_172090 [Pleurotus ostreatus PC15]